MAFFFYRFDAANDNCKNTLFSGVRVYSRGIAGFTDQWTALMRAQSAILQSRDFNLRVERMLKILYPQS